MRSTTDATTIIDQEKQEIVEIKLWGLYLLTNHASLYNEMMRFSLDHGPVEKNPQKPGRITFRFQAKEWESKIKKILYDCRVPVIFKSHDSYSPGLYKKTTIAA